MEIEGELGDDEMDEMEERGGTPPLWMIQRELLFRSQWRTPVQKPVEDGVPSDRSKVPFGMFVGKKKKKRKNQK